MSTTTTPPQRPNANNPDAWCAYWKALDQSWRTEPEIDANRQIYLMECLTIVPDPRQGRYPFKNVALSRADVEWLLATHIENSVNLWVSNLQKVDLSGLPLERAVLIGAHLERANLFEAHLEGASLIWAHLERADLIAAHLEGANLTDAHLERADLTGAHLEGANLRNAHLERADLIAAHLERADLRNAHLEGATLFESHLEGADLRGAFFTSATDLTGIVPGNTQVGFASLAGVRWGEVDLSVVDWTQVNVLGDEQQAHRRKGDDGKIKDALTRLEEYRAAVRANRQLAVALQGQGLSEEAAHFAYRAQLLLRVVLRRQRKVGRYLFSLLLDLLAGYGYRPGRSLIAYLLIIFGFMGLYLLNAHFVAPHLRWDEVLVLSLSSFHGRGFFSQDITLGDTYARLAAAEAVVGLLIEVSLIATFTQRFFGK
jgi:uncharacterized protein YjbI with pentapeptide repeats